VLSRVHVEIKTLPSWTEPITLSTWPSGVEGALALRDFCLYNNKGDKIIGATSSWLIVDTKTRRPHRPDTLKNRMPICDSFRATKCNAQKIAGTSNDIIYSYQLTTKISDIDVNGHINNTRYVEWAINSFPLEFYKNTDIKGITVNFLSEGFCDDKLRVNTRQEENSRYISTITRELDGKVLAVVEIIT
jgi:acyl-ACP thioesterase